MRIPLIKRNLIQNIQQSKADWKIAQELRAMRWTDRYKAYRDFFFNFHREAGRVTSMNEVTNDYGYYCKKIMRAKPPGWYVEKNGQKVYWGFCLELGTTVPVITQSYVSSYPSTRLPQ